MSESVMQEMREFDWALFKAARIEAIHSQEIGFQPDADGKSMMDPPLLKKLFEQFATHYDTSGTHSRYWWLEELSAPALIAEVAKLTDDDKELLTLIVVEGYSPEECAFKLHISQRGIGYRIQRILSKFTKKVSKITSKKRFRCLPSERITQAQARLTFSLHLEKFIENTAVKTAIPHRKGSRR